jgi:soluble lytic murein transglycosylase-like protein
VTDARADAEGQERRRDQERRQAERRATVRGEHDRRRSVRRRAQLRNLIFMAMTLSVAPGFKQSRLAPMLVPRVLEERVLTSIDTVSLAIPPARAYDRLIREAGALYRVSPTLIRAVMQAESAFDRLAVSRAGAMGLMQLMPETAGAYEIVDPFDPRENIMGGTRLAGCASP